MKEKKLAQILIFGCKIILSSSSGSSFWGMTAPSRESQDARLFLAHIMTLLYNALQVHTSPAHTQNRRKIGWNLDSEFTVKFLGSELWERPGFKTCSCPLELPRTFQAFPTSDSLSSNYFYVVTASNCEERRRRKHERT